MIAAARSRTERSWVRREALAPSLGLFAGQPSSQWSDGDRTFACQHGPRARPRPDWRPARGPDGSLTLFAGTLARRAELATSLGLGAERDPARLYAHAVAKWGQGADARLVGTYATLVSRSDGSWRLSRSPWDGYSLFWAGDEEGFVAASMPRALFAAGWPRRLRPDALARFLYNMGDDGEGEFRFVGVNRVPHGSVVEIDPSGAARILRWYDPLALPQPHARSDDEWVAAARALLDEAAREAVRDFARPAMLLSGGLDSPLAAEAVLRALPAGQTLPTFTFVPLPEWSDDSDDAHFGSDRDGVLGFAAMHPRIEAHFTDNLGNDFDSRLDQLVASSDSGFPSLALAAVYHGPLAAAAGHGCDVALVATRGNATYSNDAPWAYLEFARRGNWAELWRLARHHPGDHRPMWRRLAARALVPRLPGPARRLARRVVHGPGVPFNETAGLLRREAIASAGLPEAARRLGYYLDDDGPRTREEWIGALYRHDAGTELHHATEEIFGLTLRDVAAYRPLIELCLTMPTAQFVRAGEQRFLARRMAAGRLPEAQRLERRYGRHNVDWHIRMTRRLPELRSEFERMAGNPDLAAVIDTAEALRRIDNWPATAPTDPARIASLFQALSGAVIGARFWRHVSGDNR